MLSKREILVQEYSTNVLQYMLDLERSTPPLGDYLQSNPECEIQPWMRDKLVNWVFELGQKLYVSIETIQLAITLINQFLANVNTKRAVLQLVGIVSLLVAVKYHDSIDFPLKDAIKYCGGIYKKEDFQATEIFLLQKLEWCLKFPTSAEISKQLLYITGVNYDFTQVIERSNSFAMMCYGDYSLNQFSPFVISVVSVICALEQFNQKAFRNQWLKLLQEKIGLDPPVLHECKQALIRKLYRETPEQTKEKLQCLKESLIKLLS